MVTSARSLPSRHRPSSRSTCAALCRSASLLLLASAAGCGGTRGDAPGPAVVTVPAVVGEAAPAEASGMNASICDRGVVGARCDEPLDDREARALPDAIRAAHDTMVSSQFTDVAAIVRLSRLALRRDGDHEPDADGPTDAARGLRNAQRAVAIDESSPVARLALTLAIARSLQGLRSSPHPVVRELALTLVASMLEGTAGATGAVAAAAKTLAGYLAIERGDLAAATAGFDAAVALDGRVGTAWVGRGDVARLAGDPAGAIAAYQRAAAILPRDAGVARALASAQRGEITGPVALGPRSREIHFSSEPLAPASSRPSIQCSATRVAARVGATLCDGLARLARSGTRAEDDAAAGLVVDGWPEMQPLCEARDPACGPEVLGAMTAASRAFRATGHLSKSIALARLVVQHPAWPGGGALQPVVALEIADVFLSIGVFDQAASWYEQHARLGGPQADAAADRAILLRVAAGNADAATRLVDDMAHRGHLPADRRTRWIEIIGAVREALHGADAAPASATSSTSSRASCPGPLTCAVKRLAGETSW